MKSSTKLVNETSKNEIQGYLLLPSMELKEVVDLENIVVIQKFPEIFPSDIPSFPSNREIEFSIDLKSETRPISITI